MLGGRMCIFLCPYHWEVSKLVKGSLFVEQAISSFLETMHLLPKVLPKTYYEEKAKQLLSLNNLNNNKHQAYSFWTAATAVIGNFHDCRNNTVMRLS